MQPEIVLSPKHLDDPIQATLYYGQDCRKSLLQLPDKSVDTIVTSPPYWALRDYGGKDGQIGVEGSPDDYVRELVEVLMGCHRVLKDEGTMWLNLGDSFTMRPMTVSSPWNLENPDLVTALPPKNLIGIPWRVAFALQAQGWYLRSDIVWSKPNPMPEPSMDRPTRAHEFIFLMTKSAKYYYNIDAIREPHKSWNPSDVAASDYRGGKGDLRTDGLTEGFTVDGHKEGHATGTRSGGNLAAAYAGGPPGNPLGRNKRTVWHIPTGGTQEAHFATYPIRLIEPCVKAGCPKGGVVLDPFSGSGTTGVVAFKNHCNYIGLDLNAEYLGMAQRRLLNHAPKSADADDDDVAENLISSMCGGV